jgi:RNA polymerase sigma-70 factor (ECF subfamily)
MPEKKEPWQQGDVAAFEMLFRQYEKLVFRTAFLITGNKDEAEDILQEVFIAVWKSRHTFDPQKAKLSTWLHRITVNRCAREKRRKRPAALSLEETGVDLPDMSNHAHPEDILINKMEYERLLKAMEALDNRHRSVLVLRYFNDMSYQEIAEVLEVPLGTVKSRINHALSYLKQQMSLETGEAAG